MENAVTNVLLWLAHVIEGIFMVFHEKLKG
jgi:hypothetical protein